MVAWLTIREPCHAIGLLARQALYLRDRCPGDDESSIEIVDDGVLRMAWI